MKHILGVIVFYFTTPIWIVTFFVYYGFWVGRELAKKLIKATLE